MQAEPEECGVLVDPIITPLKSVSSSLLKVTVVLLNGKSSSFNAARMVPMS